MSGQYQLRLQVFSNGHFQSVDKTPWAGIDKTPGFQPLLPKLLKGEKVKHHNREFRAV